MEIERRHFLTGACAAVAAVGAAPALAAEWMPPEPDRELRVPVRGGHIYVRVNGDLAGRAAPVLFIHGGPGSGHAGHLPALRLADERAVILYDQLDAGLADHPGEPANWTVERFVSEVDAIRAALDLDRLHVVGQSWGSAIALEYAGRQPAGLVSLTLGSPLISTRSWQASTEAQLATLPQPVQDLINSHERNGTTGDPAYVEALDVFYAHFLRRNPEPAYLSDYKKRRGISFGTKVYEAMWGPGEIRATGSLKHYDGEPLLGQIAVPTLVMCGEHDEMTPTAAAPLVARIPDGRLVSVPGAGHLVAVDQPEAYVREVRSHLSRSEMMRVSASPKT